MNNRIIIAATLGMLLISFIFLSAFETKQADINKQNIWFVYFTDPKNDSLDFSIENHSQNEFFHWQIMADKKLVVENDASVLPGETKTITIPKDNIDLSKRKLSIIVIAGDNKKEIYKNF